MRSLIDRAWSICAARWSIVGCDLMPAVNTVTAAPITSSPRVVAISISTSVKPRSDESLRSVLLPGDTSISLQQPELGGAVPVGMVPVHSLKSSIA